MTRAIKQLAWLVLGLTAACQDKPISPVGPVRLIGTWNAPSASGSSYSRWTFEADYLYRTQDAVQTCQPVQSQPYQYWLENQVLIIRYAGITNGLFPIQTERFPLIWKGPTSFILDLPASQRTEFAKCP